MELSSTGWKSTLKWKNIQKYNGLEKSVTPSKISYNGQLVTSPLKIATIANNFYVNKVKQLSQVMNNEVRDPIVLLSRLIKRKEGRNFKLRLISNRETFQLIKWLPNTNSTGVDSINNQVMKKLGWSIVPQLCHMINTVIHTSTFPDIFKTTRIIPVSKPGKPTDSIDSFRPINNLPTLEKLLEQWIKRSLVDWLKGENIISGDHHGGRQGFSTLTAISSIQQQINKNLQNKNYNILLTTDIKAGFDCVDHVTLLRKMDHHGIRGPELRLMVSYLADRNQLVEVETFRSKIIKSPEMSTIQGSKLANTFYTLYTLEVPYLQYLLNCPIMFQSILTPGPRNLFNYTQSSVKWPPLIAAGSPQNIKLGLSNNIKEWAISSRWAHRQIEPNNFQDPDPASSSLLTSALTMTNTSQWTRPRQTDKTKTTTQTRQRPDNKTKSIHSNQNKQEQTYKVKTHDTKTTCDKCVEHTNKLDKNYNPDNNHYIDVTHQVTNFVDDSTSNIG